MFVVLSGVSIAAVFLAIICSVVLISEGFHLESLFLVPHITRLKGSL
jgi:hypothetical protein